MSKPILLNFPDHFETERLIIRALRPGDGPAVNAAIVESLDNLKPWMDWAQMAPTVDQTEEFVRGAAVRFLTREDLPLSMWRKSDSLYVGGTGMHRINWDIPRFEIGYWVRVSLQGQGYVTEAVNGITDFAFDVLGAKRIEIRCDPLNTRSAAVAQRAGYALEARLHHSYLGVNGEPRDTLIFAKFPPETAS